MHLFSTGSILQAMADPGKQKVMDVRPVKPVEQSVPLLDVSLKTLVDHYPVQKIIPFYPVDHDQIATYF